MADDLLEIGAFAESGRGLPINLSRPGAALPFSPLVQSAYAPTPRARLGWPAGVIAIDEVPLEAPVGVAPGDALREAARLLLAEEAGWVAVLDNHRFLGVVWADDVLGCVADDQFPASVESLISAQIPVCNPGCALVDAVRQMVATWIRRLPVVGDDGHLAGVISLSAAALAGNRDPAVRDVLEAAAPAILSRRWR
jgi:CBS domain-containing protein